MSSNTALPPISRPRPTYVKPAKPVVLPKEEAKPKADYRRFVWQGKIFPAFWTITGIVSIVVNIILIAVLIGFGRYLFTIKDLVSNQLVGGLQENFIKMDSASIITSINVSETIRVVDTIPVVFDLPLSQDTQVVLTQDTRIQGATIFLNGSPVNLNIVLPKGTPLDINLDIVVPVNQEVPVTLDVPVQLTVPVNIPLNQTELHDPFVGLRQVVEPYYGILSALPDNWEGTPLCGSFPSPLCKWLDH